MLTIFARRLVTQRVAFQALATTARCPVLFSTTTKKPFKNAIPEHQQQEAFDVDDYDHRSLQDNFPLSSKGHFSKTTAEQTLEDIDDYDHRSIFTNSSHKDSSKTKLLHVVEDFDDRSKWALGNLTTEEILQEQEEEKQVKAEKEAKKKRDDDIRHHAWYG